MKKVKILVVDDEESIRKLFVELLTGEGHEVHTAGDGYEAIQKLEKEFFEVAFIDIITPRINGLEVFRRVKELHPKTKAIMMTAYAVEELIKSALREGAACALYKPFGTKDILGALSRVVDSEKCSNPS